MRSLYIVIILSFFIGCDAYYILRPVSYNVNGKIGDDYFLINDSIKVSALTSFPKGDSAIVDLFLDIQVNSPSSKWENMELYSLKDSDSLVFKPNNVFPLEFEKDKDNLLYCYRVIFYSPQGIVLPFVFHLKDINNQLYKITYMISNSEVE